MTLARFAGKDFQRLGVRRLVNQSEVGRAQLADALGVNRPHQHVVPT